jgi:hypothetical protein
MTGKLINDLTGKQFGRITVKKRLPNEHGKIIWQGRCDCGKITKTRSDHLLAGNIVSCGCYQAEAVRRSNTTHGLNKTRVQFSYDNMLSRCYNPNAKRYERYGGRGIRVCKRWRFGEGIKSGLECFAEDMGHPPSGKSLGRMDNDGNYTKKNCRWETGRQQGNNKVDNVYVVAGGKQRTLARACRKFSVNRSSVYYHMYHHNISMQEAFDYCK